MVLLPAICNPFFPSGRACHYRSLTSLLYNLEGHASLIALEVPQGSGILRTAGHFKATIGLFISLPALSPLGNLTSNRQSCPTTKGFLALEFSQAGAFWLRVATAHLFLIILRPFVHLLAILSLSSLVKNYP